MAVLRALLADSSSALLHARELFEAFPNTVQSNDQRKTKINSERKFGPRKYTKMRKRKRKDTSIKKSTQKRVLKQWSRKD